MNYSKLSVAIRTLSSAAASAPIKPPVQVFGLEGRYATALYSAASKLKQLDAVDKDLTSLKTKIQSDRKLRTFIENPTLKRSLKSDALKHLAAKLPLSAATGNLLCLLAENGRLDKVEGVINSFKVIMAAHKGEVPCEVTTARQLDATELANLEGALKKFLKSKEVLYLTTKVDPAIIGGMVVVIGDKYVDLSVSSKVKRYSELINLAV